jgi:hypothetical protein
MTIISSIVSHLAAMKATWGVSTVKDYAGEVLQVTTLRNQLPAIYVNLVEANPGAIVPRYKIHLIISTRSASYQNSPDDLPMTIAAWLKDHNIISSAKIVCNIEEAILKPLEINPAYVIYILEFSCEEF